MQYWIIFDKVTGEELVRGSGSDLNAASDQVLQENEGILVVPYQALAVRPTDMALVVDHLHRVIDAEAEEVRSRFITPGSGQAITYMEKRLEAEAWADDPGATVPILTAEATALGVPLADVVAEVLGAVTIWKTAAALIEGTRRGAKMAVTGASGNLADMQAAAQIDWVALMQPLIDQLNGVGD